MILIISSPLDEHAQGVIDRLAAMGAETTLLDLSRFPSELELAIDVRQDGCVAGKVFGPEGEIDLTDCRVAWWRRPQPIQLPGEIIHPAHQRFAHAEWDAALAGLWSSLDVSWINHPVWDDEAGRKIFQLRIARQVGLETPLTCVTSHAPTARRFAGPLGPNNTVYKAFSATEHAWRETRLLQPAELTALENLSYAPVIFQEYIPAALDLRITWVGDQAFAAAIDAESLSYKVDYRMELAQARVEPFALPETVLSRLRALMSRLHLVYGAIDMRVTPEGRFVFLEINPSGQWLFMEEPTGLPITEAFCQLLLAKDRSGPPNGR